MIARVLSAALVGIEAALPVNLAPADLRKEGSSFDLPIALGILTATGCVKDGARGPFAVVGELCPGRTPSTSVACGPQRITKRSRNPGRL